MTIWPLVLSASLIITSLIADDTDPRLGGVQKAFVTAFDPSGDDPVVAQCFADISRSEHLLRRLIPNSRPTWC